MNPQLAYNFFMAYFESIICTENDNRVRFDHDKQSKSVFIQLAASQGASPQEKREVKDQRKKTELQALLIESLITKQRQNQKEMQECIY